MDQDKIGKFISLKRKSKKLTQKELANMLNVSEKTISKWETGRGLPEVCNMEPLCEKLSITVTELLNGQELSNLKKDNVIEYIEKNEKNRKKQIATTIVIAAFLILFSILTCYFFNTYNKVTVYELYGESEHFYYNDSLFMKSNIKEIFTEGKVEIKNNYIDEKSIKLISLYSDNQLIYKESYGYTTSNNIIENYGEDEYFNNETLNNIDKWYLEIQYEKDNNLIKERINLNNRVIMKNNKLLYLRKESKATDNIENSKNNIDSKTINLKTYLEKNGYIKKEENTYEKDILTGKIDITIRYESVYISSFKYIDKEFIVYFNPYTGNYTFINKKSYESYNYYKQTNNFYCNENKCNISDHNDISNILKNLEKEFLEVIS